MPNKFNIDTLPKDLADHKKVLCPECEKGYIVTPYDPLKSHFFHCTNCKFKVNLN